MNHVCFAEPRATAAPVCARRGRPRTGFTLVELLVVIAIIAIGLAIAVPNFGPQLQKTRATSAANDLLALLNLARAEAMRRGQRVIVCGTSTPDATDAECSGSADWSNGVAVRVENVAGASGVLRTQAFSGLTLTSTNGSTQVAFNQQGSAAGAILLYQFALQTTGAAEARALCLAASGNAYVIKTVTGGQATGTTCA